MYGPKWPFSLRYGSCDTRRIDSPRVDGLSTDPRVLGRHKIDAQLCSVLWQSVNLKFCFIFELTKHVLSFGIR